MDQPHTALPADLETLFAELPPNGVRSVEITATGPGRDFPLMKVVTAEDDAARDFGTVFRHACEVPGYEIIVRAFTG